MWLFTTTGFVSAVKHGPDLVIRARDAKSKVTLGNGNNL